MKIKCFQIFLSFINKVIYISKTECMFLSNIYLLTFYAKKKKSPKEKYGKIAGDKLEKIDISSPI